LRLWSGHCASLVADPRACLKYKVVTNPSTVPKLVSSMEIGCRVELLLLPHSSCFLYCHPHLHSSSRCPGRPHHFLRLEMADYWTKNAGLFRRLYQDERRTLDQVKAIAERELHPHQNYTLVQRLSLSDRCADSQFSISTYEARLRDILKLRKKLKKEDWYLIHQYALSRKFGRGEYEVFLNGTQIRSDRAWKEIRRYGYHKDTRREWARSSACPSVKTKKALTHTCQVCNGSVCRKMLRFVHSKGSQHLHSLAQFPS